MIDHDNLEDFRDPHLYDMHKEQRAEPQPASPGGIRAILCDVGGALIHKARTPAL